MSNEAGKTCSCGKHYSREAWSQLKCLGTVGDDVLLIEMRNCTACNSTCAIALIDRTSEEA